jgi:hypothetical protein
MTSIRQKPIFNYKHGDYITEIPNALSSDEINRLITYTNSEVSGLHRRGSKDQNIIASFYTCQVHPFDNEVYDLLSPLWEPYLNVSFIEPYEIKEYIQGDSFGYHADVYINLDKRVDRKMNLIVQLSEPNEYEGGDLVIGSYVCSKQKGTAIIFPACLHHAVTEITSGKRYSLIGHGWGPYII